MGGSTGLRAAVRRWALRAGRGLKYVAPRLTTGWISAGIVAAEAYVHREWLVDQAHATRESLAPSQGVQTAELPATYTPVPASEPVETYEMPTEGLEIELPSGIESLPVRLPSGQVHGHETTAGVGRGYGWTYIESLELPGIEERTTPAAILE